mmetsp:Transcript_25701/g.88010  ORF Transcript_25701/g.88010 Transcript_25701/m.88010 type:complete len:316 (-) Transcript_25701:685-1632(-)
MHATGSVCFPTHTTRTTTLALATRRLASASVAASCASPFTVSSPSVTSTTRNVGLGASGSLSRASALRSRTSSDAAATAPPMSVCGSNGVARVSGERQKLSWVTRLLVISEPKNTASHRSGLSALCSEPQLGSTTLLKDFPMLRERSTSTTRWRADAVGRKPSAPVSLSIAAGLIGRIHLSGAPGTRLAHRPAGGCSSSAAPASGTGSHLLLSDSRSSLSRQSLHISIAHPCLPFLSILQPPHQAHLRAPACTFSLSSKTKFAPAALALAYASPGRRASAVVYVSSRTGSTWAELLITSCWPCAETIVSAPGTPK